MLIRTPYKNSFSRRHFLRSCLQGVTASIALPTLDIMLNSHGSAWANGEAIPTRFGVWFWGNGVRPEYWIPEPIGQGNAWSLSPELQPLQDHKNELSVITGLDLKTGTHPHHAGMTGVMTGAPLQQVGVTRDTIVSTFARPSVDMIAADYYAGQTPFRSIEVGITKFRGTDEGTTFQHLSHNGPNNPNPSQYSAVQLFRRIFALPDDQDVINTRRSILDGIGQQVQRLQHKLGAHDRIRLAQHLESIRTLELRLQAEPSICMTPNEPVDPVEQNAREPIEDQNQIMSQLLTLALACDLTRTFSVQFSTCGSGVIMWQVGATDGLHRTSHDEAMSGTPATQPIIHAATTFTMQQLSYFLQQLKQVPQGDQTLLDHCSIMCTSEHADGRIHRYEDFPFLIAGKGGGRLRGNVHHKATQTSVTRAVLTALRAGGVEAESFGYEAGFTRDSLDSLWN